MPDVFVSFLSYTVNRKNVVVNLSYAHWVRNCFSHASDALKEGTKSRMTLCCEHFKRTFSPKILWKWQNADFLAKWKWGFRVKIWVLQYQSTWKQKYDKKIQLRRKNDFPQSYLVFKTNAK